MLYIIRHGQTEGNRKRTLQGRSNNQLNETGIQQAEGAREFFEANGITFDKIYSSPLDRAMDTARIAAGDDVEIVVDERIIEIDYGRFEGRSLVDPPKEIITFFSDFAHNPAPEGMEDLPTLKGRMGEFLESIAGESDRNILISTHAIAMKGALEYLNPEADGAYWSKYIANCHVFKFEHDGEGFSMPTEIYSSEGINPKGKIPKRFPKPKGETEGEVE